MILIPAAVLINNRVYHQRSKLLGSQYYYFGCVGNQLNQYYWD